MSNLSEFADIIRRQGEEKRARDLAVAKELEEGLPQFKASLAAMSIEDLFEVYDSALNGGHENYQIMPVLMTRKGMIRNEIISRTKP